MEVERSEIWKEISDFNGIYEVFNFGRFRSLNRVTKCSDGRIMNFKGKTLKLHKKSDGYVRVMLCINGKSKLYSAHRLVAKTFIPNPENKKEVNHINSDRSNNNVYNLEWVTSSENLKHSYDFGNREKKFYGYKPKTL